MSLLKKCIAIGLVIVLTAVLHFSAVQAKMTAKTFSNRLTQSARKGASPQTLWNMGFVFYYQYGPIKETARLIAEGYRQAKASKIEQETALRQGAKYWRLKYEYWGKPLPGDKNNLRKEPYYIIKKTDWESTLKMTRPEGKRNPPQTNPPDSTLP